METPLSCFSLPLSEFIEDRGRSRTMLISLSLSTSTFSSCKIFQEGLELNFYACLLIIENFIILLNKCCMDHCIITRGLYLLSSYVRHIIHKENLKYNLCPIKFKIPLGIYNWTGINSARLIFNVGKRKLCRCLNSPQKKVAAECTAEIPSERYATARRTLFVWGRRSGVVDNRKSKLGRRKGGRYGN